MGMNGRLSRELRKFCLIISQKRAGRGGAGRGGAGRGNKQLTSTVFDDFPPYSVTRQHFKVANNEQMSGKKQKPAYEQYL